MDSRRRLLALPPHAQAILAILFPTLEVTRIRWLEGIPRLFRFGQTAITLGAPSPRRTADVFFAPGHFDASTCTGLALLVHETAHVWQVRGMARGRGFWIVRLFYLRYVADWIRHGLRHDRIRYEREASSLERRFLEAARAVARARPDQPRLRDGLPDPAEPGFAAALAAEWSRFVPFRET